jgi:hypothetical protein
MADAPPASPAAKPSAAAVTMKIQLDKASREELVEFIKKQNQHIKTMETKSAGINF